MKKRLLLAAALTLTLVLPFSRRADAQRDQCYEENYGSQCGTTCVFYNDQGSVMGWATTFHAC
jgi:hypothetical protein